MNKVIKSIGDKFFNMYKGNGYFYFVYDDGNEIFETESVYVCHFNHLPLNKWIEAAKSFVAKVKA